MAAPDPQPQSVTSAWTQALRNEVRRREERELARLAHVGFMMATFANADGTSITTGQKLLATLTGSTQESVSRAIKVLVGVGLLRARRRPNQSTEYILVIPMQAPDWDQWMPVFTETRHKRRHQAAKAAAVDELLASRASDGVPGRTPDTVRAHVPDSVRAGVPEHVRAGGSEPPEEDPDTVRARTRTAGAHAFRTPCAPGGTMTHLPPVVTSTEDLDTVAHSPQPQVGGGEPGEPNRIQLVPPLPEDGLDPGVALRRGLQSKPKRHTPWIDRRGQS